MADEAVLRIVVQDEGGVNQATPADEGPPASGYSAPPVAYPTSTPTQQVPRAAAPAASPPQATRSGAAFDPTAEAYRLREAEVRREQIKLAYDHLYDTTERANKAMDTVCIIAEKLRGKLGGTFGPLVGSLLDVFAALRQLRNPAEEEVRQEA